MVHCCVPLCKNSHKNVKSAPSKVSFHWFPKEKHLRKEWIVHIRRDEGPLFKVGCNHLMCMAKLLRSLLPKTPNVLNTDVHVDCQRYQYTSSWFVYCCRLIHAQLCVLSILHPTVFSRKSGHGAYRLTLKPDAVPTLFPWTKQVS